MAARSRFLDRLRRRGRRAARAPLGEHELRDAVAELLRAHDTTTQRVEAAAIADAYLTLRDDERLRFLHMLGHEFWTDVDAVDAAAGALGGGDRRAAERALRDALTPAATRVLRSFTTLDGGVKFLVDLRGDLLRLGIDTDALADLDNELKASLATLFDVGLLELRRITWDAPASLLETLIEHEAVHAIGSWADLKNRLDSDRRCYAFFHPAMPSEPIVFVEIALTTGITTELPPLLDALAPELDPEHADTAVFYSISSCQPGLAGVNLGTALIKQVVEELRHDLTQLRRFVTLSPIPGFRAWLDRELSDAGEGLHPRERERLPAEPARVLARLADEEWAVDEAVRPALLALCARYLTTTRDGRVLDPVANFHLANGATIERVNWLADPSPTGRERSAGIMANYLYEPDRIAERAENYVSRGEVTFSGAVRELLAE